MNHSASRHIRLVDRKATAFLSGGGTTRRICYPAAAHTTSALCRSGAPDVQGHMLEHLARGAAVVLSHMPEPCGKLTTQQSVPVTANTAKHQYG
jgi:hypothetical protein